MSVLPYRNVDEALMEVVPTILVFIAVIAVTVVLFGAWALFTVVRLIISGLNALTSPKQPQRLINPSAAAIYWTCNQTGCRSTNPAVARFCRRCGRAAVTQQSVNVRRVAAML